MVRIELTDAEADLLERWLDAKLDNLSWSVGGIPKTDEARAISSLYSQIHTAIPHKESGQC